MTPLRISELAAQADVPVSTLRYYERIGLLCPVERRPNGYRSYDESSAERLAFIGRAKRMGISLGEVAGLLELWSAEGCRPLQERIHTLLSCRLEAIHGEQVNLTAFESQLRSIARRLEGTDGAPALCESDCDCTNLHEADRLGSGYTRTATALQLTTPGCTLDLRDQQSRLSEWRSMIGTGEIVGRTATALRLALPASAETAASLAQLCIAEVDCCSTLRFTIEVSPAALILVVEGNGTPQSAELIQRLFS